jgi:hypothetical protein
VVERAFLPETDAALQRLGNALVAQLESPNRETWSELQFEATRALLEPFGETHRMRLTVSCPNGEFPLIPRPAVVEACAELDRVSTLGSRPRWRNVRLLLRRAEGGVSFKCWWGYDQPRAATQASGRLPGAREP